MVCVCVCACVIQTRRQEEMERHTEAGNNVRLLFRINLNCFSCQYQIDNKLHLLFQFHAVGSIKHTFVVLGLSI